jgi:hypothetical protein
MVQTGKSRAGSSPQQSTRERNRVRFKGNDLVYALPEPVNEFLLRERPPTGVDFAFVATTPGAKEKLRAFVSKKYGEVIDHDQTHEEVETNAYSLGPRARALLQGSQIAAADLKEAGGAFDLEQVQTVLNGVSRQAIEKRVKEGSLLAVPGPSNRRRYPSVQFTCDGLVPGLKEVQHALPTRNPWAVLNFFVRPDDRLGGRKPIDVLRSGDVELVVSAARGMGMQGG